MKQPWHQPRLQLLDARATAQTDQDAYIYDVGNFGANLGDPASSETTNDAGGHHAQADAS